MNIVINSLMKVGYTSLIIVGYNKGVGPLTKSMDALAEKYLPESWIKWIPTSYIANAVLLGSGAFGMHKLQALTQPIKMVHGKIEYRDKQIEIRNVAKDATLPEKVLAVGEGLKGIVQVNGLALFNGGLGDSHITVQEVGEAAHRAIQVTYPNPVVEVVVAGADGVAAHQ